MATKKKAAKKSEKSAAKKVKTKTFPAKFGPSGSTNYPKGTSGIGIVLDKGGVDLATVDDLICGGALKACVTCQPAGSKRDVPGQTLIETAELAVEFICTCLGLSGTRPATMSFKLNFFTADVDMKKLGKVYGGTGKIKITRTGDCNAEDETEEESDDDESDANLSIAQ